MLRLSIAQECQRRDAPVKALFPKQRKAAQSSARKKAIRTPRRAGKSTCILSSFLSQGMHHAKSKFPYIMLTRGQCEDVAWPVLKSLDEKFDCKCKFNESNLHATMPNGSRISMYGADRPGWMGRMRGAKNRAAAIDEAQEFAIDLDGMVKEIIWPTLWDYSGELWLGGTPGKVKKGLFYEVTQNTGAIAGYEVHKWSTSDNPYMAKQYAAEIENLKAENPGIDIMKLPYVMREYFGEWVVDESDSVYHYDPEKNAIHQWKQEPGDEFVCGIDLGWHDRTAFVVGCYGPHRPEFTILEAYRHPKMLIDDAARIVRDFSEQYPGIRFCADPSRRQLLEELQVRADIFIDAAEKTEKKDWIELVNRDLMRGAVKILHPEKSVLAEEMLELKWQARPSGIVVEHPSMKNDACDSFLYAFRMAGHHYWSVEKKEPDFGTPEYYKQEEKRLRLAQLRAIRDNESSNWWEKH